MGSDANQSLSTAEKLLKQGKIDDAISLCNGVIDASRGDLLTVNRVGDILAATGYGDRAVDYYARIADQFARQGYYPKAIAVRKKVLRLTPERPESLVALADLYVAQQHPGEARNFYLRAADILLESRDFDGAREVYERLVRAEPEEPRHRVRLAETRAAAGDAEGAARDLIDLGERLLQSGKPEDAERAYRRAGELQPGLPGIVRGLIGCYTETGRDDEALELLEAEARRPEPEGELLGELLLLCETNERSARTDELLQGPHAGRIPESVIEELTRFHQRRDSLGAWWSRFARAASALSDDADLLERFAGWVEPTYLPALHARRERAASEGDVAAEIRVIERLVTAAGQSDEAAGTPDLLERLAELQPESPLLARREPAADAGETVSAEVPAAEAGPAAPVEGATPEIDVPVEYEAPAVPLSRADEEFVAGRMTQAEILEKYGLISQAIDQLYEVIDRFPGHLEANQRLVTLIRNGGQPSSLGPALVKLGLARRAAGRMDVARQSISEADRLAGIDDAMRPVLAALGLLDAPEGAVQESPPAPEAARPAEEPPAVEPPAPSAAQPVEAPVEAAAETPAAEVAGDGDSVIDFDAFDDDEGETEVEPPVAAAPPAVPATQPVAAAPEPDVAEDSDRGTADAMRFEPLPAISEDPTDDDDLSAIAAALDEELFDDDPLPEIPQSESEESIEEVFAAFRERVQAEVSDEDFRTHYDLGIGYKEMGLVDAAIAEFEISSRSADLYQQSCVMLAICHRERAELDAAADWYRHALDAAGDEHEAVTGLRYELAEVLLEAGDAAAALGLFRDVMLGDPSFRDVSRRVEELAAAVSE